MASVEGLASVASIVFQSEMHYDQHDDDLVALIVVKISKGGTPLATFF